VVTADDGVFLEQCLGIADQSPEPRELVIEFRALGRIAVRQVEAANHQLADLGLDVATVCVDWIAGQASPALHWLSARRENCHSVVRPLTVPEGTVAGSPDGIGGEFLVG